ncbi:coniferyl-aldehyde dehydrogenase [Duganella sp. CF458]|uniref:coniferyl aldehyde dehydrogenase n=1 Tax=Duganella sp. CF458 TaxID=1884368 RepID=UPI0008EE198C|nr:coniferyl aldehyde dehydrogenase [Duganella sp. CF458]SFG95974.1 coniferyl-aldehyde dehydrogenase [Duganella sp. CF458]
MKVQEFDPAVVGRGASSLLDVLEVQRAAFNADMVPAAALRRERLDRLQAMVADNEPAILAAIDSDFGGRARQEMVLTELFVVLSAIRQQRRKLGRWMRPRRVATPLHMLPGSSRIMPQPLGVIGNIVPWNYPCQLALVPAAAALAAGNRVMIKPSELTPAFSRLLAQLAAQYFSPAELAVVEGGVEVSRDFAALPFDHLIFTGSTAVGRQVAVAAAHNLTPVTLELGGKSPAIIDESCDLAESAPRLAFGKLFNAGQTCVAPDYALVPRARVEEFVREVSAAAAAMYPRFAGNEQYTSIISERHHARLQQLVQDAEQQGARVVHIGAGAGAGAAGQAGERRMAPVLLLDVTPEMAVMREEIFGPLLPVVPYDTLQQAIAFINQRERPLALYWFGKERRNCTKVLHSTISGGVTINDALWHAAQENLPFGGVGASGTGAYHGEHGFLAFSKQKPIYRQARLNGFGLFRPPYGRVFDTLADFLKRHM